MAEWQQAESRKAQEVLREKREMIQKMQEEAKELERHVRRAEEEEERVVLECRREVEQAELKARRLEEQARVERRRAEEEYRRRMGSLVERFAAVAIAAEAERVAMQQQISQIQHRPTPVTPPPTNTHPAIRIGKAIGIDLGTTYS